VQLQSAERVQCLLTVRTAMPVCTNQASRSNFFILFFKKMKKKMIDDLQNMKFRSCDSVGFSLTETK
jgi:hypothetical protein